MQQTAATQPTEYVYEAPVRLWHWINAVAITVLAVSGYFIASPPYAGPGEASDQYLMGIIRFIHFAAGYILAVGLLGRIYWAFMGNHHARQLFYLPFWDRQWRADFVHEARWYAFLEQQPRKHAGHNPLAQTAMLVLFLLTTVFMVASGFALYSEGAGDGHWSGVLFGWVLPLLGGSQLTHTWHHLGMWVLIIFIIAHVYTAIREDIMSRQTMISTMVSGWRFYKNKRIP